MGKYLKNAKAVDPVTGEISYINGYLCEGFKMSDLLKAESDNTRLYSDDGMTEDELNEYMKREEEWMNETYELNKDYLEDENAQKEHWLKLTGQKK